MNELRLATSKQSETSENPPLQVMPTHTFSASYDSQLPTSEHCATPLISFSHNFSNSITCVRFMSHTRCAYQLPSIPTTVYSLPALDSLSAKRRQLHRDENFVFFANIARRNAVKCSLWQSWFISVAGYF